MKFVFEQIRTRGDRNFAYLVGDREAGVAALASERDSRVFMSQREPGNVIERSRQNCHKHCHNAHRRK